MTITARAARFPAEYGQTDESRSELQEWSDVAARIAAAKNYFLATTTDDGRPHVRPIDGVFVDDTLAFAAHPRRGGCAICNASRPSRRAFPTTITLW